MQLFRHPNKAGASSSLIIQEEEEEEKEEEGEKEKEGLIRGSKLESHLVTRDFDVSSEAQLILALLLVILSHNKLC